MQISAELNNKILTQRLEIEEKKRKIAMLEKSLVILIFTQIKFSMVLFFHFIVNYQNLGSTARIDYSAYTRS